MGTIIDKFNLSQESYDIEPELRVRKLLEQSTPFSYVLMKNEDPYGRDLEIWKYKVKNNPATKTRLGYVEVERARLWKDEKIPSNWIELSFLMRKLFIRNDGDWGGPKEDSGDTIYLKMNHSMTNCFCASMDYIIHHGKESNRSNSAFREDSFWSIPKDDPGIAWGLKDCVTYILQYFDEGIQNLEHKQPALWTDDELAIMAAKYHVKHGRMNQ